MGESFRKERVSDLLLSFLATELRKLNDPRLELVTLTDVDLTPDFKVAHVYWTSHEEPAEGAEKRREELAAIDGALSGAESLFKRLIGRELKLRYIPRLIFHHDNSLRYGARIDELLKKAGF